MQAITDLRPAVEFHTEAATEIDPVTFEVVRNKLWNINVEHGNTILRASGGPIVVYGHDFNPAILTEDAEFLFYGPYIQFLASAQDLMVKWTLEHRAENPGIHDGDMFISNDPFIGATHQNDAALLCPVFVDDRIFCWATNSMHQTDVGGTTPGSFCADAPDIFHEPTPIQPIKIVDRGEVRSDIIHIYLRQSRAPHLLALDLRAGISGNNVSKQSILALVERYGADVVKGVMRRIISHSEQVIRDRLERLPDGVFRDRRYVECALPGDRGLYELGFSIDKTGSRLSISNEGSAPQAGALNCSFGGWRSGVINALAIAFCTDLYYAIGGLIRCMDFSDVVPRTICTAEYPASVSNGPNAIIMAELGQIGNALGRMMVSDETQRSKIFTSAGMNGASVDGMHAIAADGNMWASINFEMMSGAIGAFATKDGVPSGGLIFDLKGRAPDVETLELGAPVLYLYRREYADSAGVGRWARGNSVGAAFVPHGTDAVFHNPSGVGVGVPISTGLFGGFPANTNILRQMRDTDVHEQLRRGEIPLDLDHINGTLRRLQPRETGVRQGPEDVHLFLQSAGAGYGDPLLREPERVLEDIALGYVSAPAARELYGVVIAGDEVDAEATVARRAEIRAERLGSEPPNAISERDGHRFTETLIIEDDRIVCRMCGHDVGGLRALYKDGLARRDRPVTAAGPLIDEPSHFIDAELQFREFSCPGCGTLVETEVARAEDPVLSDIELR